MSSPPGVTSYGHKHAGKPGAHVPTGASGSGPNTVSKQGGSPPAIPATASGGTHQPSGVIRGDGKDPKGSAPKTKQATSGTPGSGSGNANPKGVRSFGAGAKRPSRSSPKDYAQSD